MYDESLTMFYRIMFSSLHKQFFIIIIAIPFYSDVYNTTIALLYTYNKIIIDFHLF